MTESSPESEVIDAIGVQGKSWYVATQGWYECRDGRWYTCSETVNPFMTDKTPEKSPELVDHPDHYNAHPSGVECIDVIEWLTHNCGAAVKYLWRAGLKPGNDVIQDLKKARWYIDREIERLSK